VEARVGAQPIVIFDLLPSSDNISKIITGTYGATIRDK
jgi:hypothetical protein